MPEQIKVGEYIRETWDDYNSPTTSNFINRISHCRNTVNVMEESLDGDRSGLNKLKKTIKALYNSGISHIQNEQYLTENLERLGTSALQNDTESHIGAAFLKFALIAKELSAIMKNLMQSLNNGVLFPLDNLLKGDLRGVKGDLRKPVDKTWKEYDTKFTKIEKEKKQLAKEAGMVKTDLTGAEIAEELEKERGMFQLQMTEYLLKFNDIKTKKGVDLLQHLVEFYYAQTNFFTDGLKTVEQFKSYVEELVIQLNKIKLRQDTERRDLTELRDVLKTKMATYNKESTSTTGQYNLHQLTGNKVHGFERTGYLLKKSEGKMRKVWQKRKCIVKDGFLSISHSDVNKPPVKLNLLTCSVKLRKDDPGNKCFDLVSSSKNRTYHFQGEDTQEMEAWISVLNNAKESVLMKAFGENTDKDSSPINQSVKELTRSIIETVRLLPGNNVCCDCNASDPEWLSVNLGVLICLECCGVHREMGVHISRTQSIVIDDLGTSQLLLARVVGNKGLNEIMEATLDPNYKPAPHSSMDEKKSFIRAKYERRRYCIITCTNMEDRKYDLKQAVLLKDILALVQVYAEGVPFMDPLPDMAKNETALHLAIQEEDSNRSLYMVDFIIQNSNAQSLSRADSDGNTALHYCALYDRTECIKLLLRIRPDIVKIENNAKETALEIARSNNHDVCVQLISHAVEGKSEMFNNVNIDWGLAYEDRSYEDFDYSDDDLDKNSTTPDRSQRSRPGSVVMGADVSASMHGHQHSRDRASSMVTESLRSTLLPNAGKTKSTGLILPSGLSGSAQSLVSGGTLQGKRKPPAPPPPTYRDMVHTHSRKHSDPGFGITHCLSMSMPSNNEPPPLPEKINKGGLAARNNRTRRKSYAGLSGAKLVLPPPPEFRNMDNSQNPLSSHNTKSLPQDDYIKSHTSANTKPQVQPKPQVRSNASSIQNPLRVSQPTPTDQLTISSVQNRHQSRPLPPEPGLKFASNDNLASSSPLHPHFLSGPTMHPTQGVNNNRHDSSSSDNRNANAIMSRSANFSLSLGLRDGEEMTRSSRGGSTDSQASTNSPHQTQSPPVFRKNARCRALYDCEADHEDELSFREGEVIIVLAEEEEEWWEGYIEGQSNRKGMFPATFVELIT